jgi:hypothetical protein
VTCGGYQGVQPPGGAAPAPGCGNPIRRGSGIIAVPEATLDIGWELLSALPEEELNPIDE